MQSSLFVVSAPVIQSCQVAPRLHESLKDWRNKLQSLDGSYWKAWDDRVERDFAPHERDHLACRYLVALREYVDTGPQRRTETMSLHDIWEIHKTEAEIRHELDSKWSKLGTGLGALELAQVHAYHFTVRDRQNERYHSDWWDPAPDHLYLQVDFKEHDTLPVGPPPS